MKFCGSTALKLCLILVMAAPAALPASKTLSASPDNVDFQYSQQKPLPNPVVVKITASDNSTPAITVSVAALPGTPSTLFPQPSITGESFQIGIDVNTLNTLLSQPGAVYGANLTVSASGFTSLTIPVTLSINGTLAIDASPTALSFTAPTGATVQTVSLTGNGASNVSFTLSSSTASGGNWLGVTTSADFTPATLTVTVNPLIVPSGNYSGIISITPSTTGLVTTIPVTLQVGTNSLSASPSTFTFSYIQGSTIPLAQALALASTTTKDTFTAQATSTGNWLLINGVTSNVTGSLPATLNVTVNPANLAIGTYQGSINITDANSNTQTVTASLIVSGLSGIANPTVLMFVAQLGGAPPAQQAIAIQGFGAASYTAQVSQPWLSVSSLAGVAPAQISASANPAGLSSGTYDGIVTISVSGHVQTIQVTFVVSASPVLTTTPGDLFITYIGGGAPPPPTLITVNASSGSSESFSFATGVPSWLQIGPAGSLGTPDTLSITVTPQTLPTGTYLAQIILTPSGTGAVSTVVPLLLTVSNAPPVTPSVTLLTFSSTTGSAAVSQTVGVTATTPTSFTAAATTTTGGSWLSVSPTSATTGSGSVPLTVTANPGSLAAGTYLGEISLTTAGGVVTQVAVTFTVSTGNIPFAITPATLAFNYTQTGTVPAAQAVQVTGSQSYTAAATTTTGGAWLAVTPASGTGNGTLSVSVAPTTLAAGSYTGTVTVTPTGGTAQTVAVTLTVASSATLTATPNPLAFTYAVGNPNPPPQTVSVTSSGAAIAFTATASSSGWLSVAPTSGTTPATLTVTVNPANLGAGTYQGSVALSGGNGASQFLVNVTLTVSATLPTIDRLVNSASYGGGGVSPGEIVVLFGSGLGPSTGVTAQIDSKGFIETSLANVSVTFNGFPAPLLYASGSQINAIVPYELAGTSDASVTVIFGKARSNAISLPVVSSAPGVYSADQSGLGPGAILDKNYKLVTSSNPAGPADIIQIFATGQGQTSPAGVDGLIEPSVLPLPYPLGAPAVLIGGFPATVTYFGAAPGLVAGALQVNAVVPLNVAPGNAQVLVFVGPNASQNGITVSVK
jgi:uncharacterized protein (TIGR03437 family)